jgi:hypothetical protein
LAAYTIQFSELLCLLVTVIQIIIIFYVQLYEVVLQRVSKKLALTAFMVKIHYYQLKRMDVMVISSLIITQNAIILGIYRPRSITTS